MRQSIITYSLISSITFALICLIFGIIMTKECISIVFYEDSCCEIIGQLDIQKSLSSAQGSTMAKICDTEQNLTLRYPPSRYWRLYVNSQNEIENWYNSKNDTFFCKTDQEIAVTEDCDYVLPLLGIILSFVVIFLASLCLYYHSMKNNKNIKPEFITKYINPEFRPIHQYNSVKSKRRRPTPIPLLPQSYEKLQTSPIYSTIESPTGTLSTTL